MEANFKKGFEKVAFETDLEKEAKVKELALAGALALSSAGAKAGNFRDALKGLSRGAKAQYAKEYKQLKDIPKNLYEKHIYKGNKSTAKLTGGSGKNQAPGVELSVKGNAKKGGLPDLKIRNRGLRALQVDAGKFKGEIGRRGNLSAEYKATPNFSIRGSMDGNDKRIGAFFQKSF